MKETKQTLTQKTHKVNLPDVSPYGKKVIYVGSGGDMGLGFPDSHNTPFNGERPIVAPIPGLQGKTLHGGTTGEVLDNLLKALYPTQPPTCSLTASNPQREHGAAPDVTLTYNAYPGDNSMDIINVNGVTIDLSIPQGTQDTATVQDTDTTYTMLVQDDEGLQGVSTATVQYFHNRYWFQSSTNLLTDSDTTISSVLQGTTSKEFSTSRQMNRSFTLVSEYVYFAYPASFGPASFIVGGLPNTAYQLKQFMYTNLKGYVEPYYLYRSGNAGTGSINVTLN